MWSQLSQRFNSDTEVLIPADENWILDQNMNVGTLTIEGKLTWSLSRRNLELKALYVLVEKVCKQIKNIIVQNLIVKLRVVFSR